MKEIASIIRCIVFKLENPNEIEDNKIVLFLKTVYTTFLLFNIILEIENNIC